MSTPALEAPAPRQAHGAGRHAQSLEVALAAADWLTPVHAATVAYARSLAELLDAMTLDGTLPGRAEPQYLLALRALGLATAAAPTEAPAPMLNVASY